MIENDITPRLEKLRSQQKEYMTWMRNKNELDSLKRLEVAYSWYTTRNSLQQSDQSESTLRDKLEDNQENLQKLQERMKAIEEEVEVLVGQRSEVYVFHSNFNSSNTLIENEG